MTCKYLPQILIIDRYSDNFFFILTHLIDWFIPSNWNLGKIFAPTGPLGQVHMVKEMRKPFSCNSFYLIVMRKITTSVIKMIIFPHDVLDLIDLLEQNFCQDSNLRVKLIYKIHGDQKWRWQTNNGSQICSIPLLEVDDKRVRTKREQLDLDEKEVKGGFQNIGNMGRFLKAAQMMGTRRLP